VQSARGRQASLLALQEAALGDTDAAVAAWLEAQGLAVRPAWPITSRWSQAGSARWRWCSPIICAPSAPRARPLRHGLADGAGPLALFDTGAPAGAPALDGRLAGRVRCPWPLDGLLAAVYTADDLGDALARRGALEVGETLVTRDGTLVGHNWLRTPEGDNPLGGVLQRGEDLKALDQEIAELEERTGTAAAAREALGGERRVLEEARDALVTEAARVNRELAAVRADLTGRRTRLEHHQERRAALEAERVELSERLEEALAESAEARERLHAALEEIDAHAEQREGLAAHRESLRDDLAAARADERQRREQVHRLTVSIESRRAAREATGRNLERSREQCEDLAERRLVLREDLEAGVEPLAAQQQELAGQLEARLTVERELTAARERLEGLETRVRELDQERQRIERDLGERQRELDGLRLARQELLIRRRTLEEQLAEAGQRAAEILATLQPEAAAEAWQEELTKIEARIQRLGNINLAAIDEFREQSERKGYLDAQHEDISRSLDTLEQAIRRIDRETRSRFKDTYDQVNHGFQALFPRLFGGGHAYLELTGEDLLETGVTVMARPPGKRNSSIHLLSGGEKALTAVALVFAIFQLNPAPFCMLDEVDAPLDDANVGRFCELVRSMSDQVQFIFITHNKVTMEIADQLLGVTMHEPGVSRLVSVDVDEAARLAAAS
jgi:chromosome segregation protein